MPRIFDNIEKELLPALQETLDVSYKSDFCVGYFNLRGWKRLDAYIEKWAGGENSQCRLLVGMQRLPAEELQECLSLIHADQTIDNQTALRLRKKLAEEFRDQLAFGVPTNEDEAGLRRLAAQLKAHAGPDDIKARIEFAAILQARQHKPRYLSQSRYSPTVWERSLLSKGDFN